MMSQARTSLTVEEAEFVEKAALWSAAACCRFRSGKLAGRAQERGIRGGEARASSREEGGSKLPHSRGPVAALAGPVVAALVLFAVTLAPNLYSQTWNSHLEGMVLDQSGAAIPAASLELRNPATGQIRRTQTGENGFYTFPFLPVGSYEMEIAKAGFVSKVVRGLVLRVGEPARLNIRLEIAPARSEIQVDARPPLVEAASPAIGDEIEIGG
jgi:hypothetical protein